MLASAHLRYICAVLASVHLRYICALSVLLQVVPLSSKVAHKMALQCDRNPVGSINSQQQDFYLVHV